MNLLEKMKAYQQAKSKSTKIERITPEDRVAIALAWLKDEVTYTQIAKGGELRGSNVYNLLASGIRIAYLKGILKIKE